MLFKIVGTSHISRESVAEIEQAIIDFEPQIVAIELDIKRAIALTSNKKAKSNFRDIFKIGVKAFIFVKVGQYVQQKLGKMVGVIPGSEMKAAMFLAKKKKLKIALIDQPIDITLKKLSKAFTWREKWNFIKDIFRGIFFRKKQLEKLGLDEGEVLDLTKVPSEKLIKKLLKSMKRNYPSIYEVILEGRNRYMVKALININKKNPGEKILVVVGAAHKNGMDKLLSKYTLK